MSFLTKSWFNVSYYSAVFHWCVALVVHEVVWKEEKLRWMNAVKESSYFFACYSISILVRWRDGGSCLSVVTRPLCSCQLSLSAVVASFSTGITGNLISLSVRLSLCLPSEPPLTPWNSSCRQCHLPSVLRRKIEKANIRWTPISDLIILWQTLLCCNDSQSWLYMFYNAY